MCQALHGFGHAKTVQPYLHCCYRRAEVNAANLVAQLQVEIVDRQQRSTKLADSETIKNELEAMVPFCRSNFMLY